MFGVKAVTSRSENMPERAAARFRIRGLVQGVGFRPFVYRLARGLDPAGWVCNDAEGVLIQAEGTHPSLVRFEQLLDAPEDSPDAVERARLSDLIYRYEEIHFPMPEPTRWQSFRFRLDQMVRQH